MYKNFLIILLRNIYREKSYAAINVIGLALALSCSFILICYIQNEMSYDQHNKNFERVVRINSITTANGKEERSAFSSLVTGPLITREYPQLGEYVRFTRGARRPFSVGEKEAYWDDTIFADENLFDVMTHKIIYGDLNRSLEDPRSMAVSKSFAEFFFGDRDPVGEMVKSGEFEARIAAVFDDLPENSHLKYNVLLSANSLKDRFYNSKSPSPEQLKEQSIYTYFLLAPGIEVDYLNQLLSEFSKKTALDISPNQSYILEYQATKLADMHFDNLWQDDLPTGNIFYAYVLIIIVILIMLVASINYVNLALARAMKRRKEVYVRKVLGADSIQLIQQFMFESTFYMLVASTIGLILVLVARDIAFVNDLVSAELISAGLTDPTLILGALAGVIVLGLLTGIYPAFYLLKFANPHAGGGAGGKPRMFDLRSSLVFLQYFITIGVIAFTLLMERQLDYVANKPIGYEPDNKVLVHMRGVDTIEKSELIKAELIRHDGIMGVTESSFFPGAVVEGRVLDVENNEGGIESISVHEIKVEKDFIRVMGAKIDQGRDFSQRLLTDIGTSIIVNQAMVQAMGWENPLNKRVLLGNSRVIGVVKDFHFNSLHQTITPMVLMLYDNDFSAIPDDMRGALERPMVINIDASRARAAISHIETVMTRFDTVHSFEYEFVDELLKELYVKDANLFKLSSVFSVICIIISALGLLGLSTYTGEQRKKEVAVRRVLGATTGQLVFTLIKPQIILVALASIAASVVSFRVMGEWLSNFAYRTPIEVWIFLAASVTVSLIAFITMALQTTKTAQSNPVFALRSE